MILSASVKIEDKVANKLNIASFALCPLITLLGRIYNNAGIK